jgi:GDPmannose 4,6-dehydratase
MIINKEQTLKKTAIITGITGQDGSYLADFLLEKGYRVIGLKRRTSVISTDRIDHVLENQNHDFVLEYYNLHDSGVFYRLISKYQPAEIYHLAAQSHVRVSFEVPEETVATVAMGSLRILEAIRTLNPNIRYYQASSSEMYGDNTDVPQNEETRFLPASPYACAKAFAHNLCRNYRESYGMHISSGILFNHESPRRGETFVTRKITIAAAKIACGMQDKLYLGNLDSKRDWGYAGDYVEAMWKMVQHDEPGDFVIATGKTYTVRQFLQEVFDLAGLKVADHVEIDQKYFRPHEVPVLLGDPSKAKRILDWEPKVNFEELAKMMFESDLRKVKGE